MIPFDVLPCIEEGGLMGLSLYSGCPIERRVADSLIRLTMCRSENWKTAMRLEGAEAVSVEISLEELAMILERVDLRSGRLEDIQAINFWPDLLAAMEFLEALDFRWESTEFGFDCHESYMVRWTVPEGLAGYLIWLLRHGRKGAEIPADIRYHEFSRKRTLLIERLTDALATHMDSLATATLQVGCFARHKLIR